MMKKLFIYASLLLGVACNNADSTTASVNSNQASSVDSMQVTSIEWIEPKKNLGKITEGQVLQIQFKFKNTGDKPLIIKSVAPSCGCTVADFPKQPIQPGKEGTIIASFDSKGRLDLQKKELYVEANTKGTTSHTLHFELEVIKTADAKAKS